MNCVQNQVTIRNRVLLRNKVAAFIITGGQDNVQAVAGQMLGFFGEIGCLFPQFPYIAHSRGWSAEDMERNVAYVQQSESLHQAARELAGRSVDTAKPPARLAGRAREGRPRRPQGEPADAPRVAGGDGGDDGVDGGRGLRGGECSLLELTHVQPAIEGGGVEDAGLGTSPETRPVA